MNRYQVCTTARSIIVITGRDGAEESGRKMNHPVALQRIKVGVPATVEHSGKSGPETAK